MAAYEFLDKYSDLYDLVPGECYKLARLDENIHDDDPIIGWVEIGIYRRKILHYHNGQLGNLGIFAINNNEISVSEWHSSGLRNVFKLCGPSGGRRKSRHTRIKKHSK